MTYRPLKHCFIDYTQVAFWDSHKADIEFSVPFGHLNHRLLVLAKVSFWVCQKAENPFAGCFENMKHLFIDFT
jgi:hypothetical protein